MTIFLDIHRRFVRVFNGAQGVVWVTICVVLYLFGKGASVLYGTRNTCTMGGTRVGHLNTQTRWEDCRFNERVGRLHHHNTIGVLTIVRYNGRVFVIYRDNGRTGLGLTMVHIGRHFTLSHGGRATRFLTRLHSCQCVLRVQLGQKGSTHTNFGLVGEDIGSSIHHSGLW